MAANSPYQAYQHYSHYPPAPGSAAAGQQTTGAPTPPPVENIQPSVRVMRLYKPGFHIASTLPFLPERNLHPRDGPSSEAAEFALSNHLILPDNFGDIYLGEKFSAYITIVNGFANIPFYNVNLSVRLQTATTTIDLADCRPRSSPSSLSNILSYNESSEVIVSHLLNELGTHTLRVSVQYSLAYNAEIKTLRKFYRFNVLNPLLVLSSFMEVNQLPMVQCQVTNSTKSPIFIEDMEFVSRNKDALFTHLHQLNGIDKVDAMLSPTDIVLLNPDESFAFAFYYTFYDSLVDKTVGYPVIKWCNSLGDSAVFRGEETVIKNSFIPTMLLPQPVKGLLLQAPGVVFVDEVIEVSIRLYNTSSMNIPITLSCKNHALHHHGHQSDDRVSLHAPPISFNPSFDDSHRGLIFTGLTSQYLGILASDQTLDIHINLYAASSGLYDLPAIGIINVQTKERYLITGLAKILVQERAEGEEEAEEDGSPHQVIHHHLESETEGTREQDIASRVLVETFPEQESGVLASVDEEGDTCVDNVPIDDRPEPLAAPSTPTRTERTEEVIEVEIMEQSLSSFSS